jgi:hypothetical protein
MSAVGAVYGVLPDGTNEGIAIGDRGAMLEQFKIKNPQRFHKIKFFDTNGLRKSRSIVVDPQKPKPKPKAKKGNGDSDK